VKAIFFGTPEIAVPVLNALCEVAEVVGVVCQPDRPSGRGMKLNPPAVKIRALELGLSVFQPEKVRDGALATWIRQREADVALVIAYGRILGRDVLDAPRLGCVNLHASLLPKYRGAAPIQRAIFDGERETGICLMKMDEGMDTGDVLARCVIPIDSEETAGTLTKKLGEVAARMTLSELPRYVAGELIGSLQDHRRATFAPPIEKADTLLDFHQSAELLSQRIRGLAPRPGGAAHLNRDGKAACRLKVYQAIVVESPLDRELSLDPGEVRTDDGKLLIGTGSMPLELQQAQVEGKRVQSAQELINGRSLKTGDRLS
jgi:methionyl-tRNA formyltransferase